MSASIAFLEDNDELREVLAEVAKSELGEDSICFRKVEDLIAHESEVLLTKMAILDLNLGQGQSDGVDAFYWLKDHGYQGKICFLTGHGKTHPLVTKASEIGAEIWTKPMYASKLCEAIRSVIQK